MVGVVEGVGQLVHAVISLAVAIETHAHGDAEGEMRTVVKRPISDTMAAADGNQRAPMRAAASSAPAAVLAWRLMRRLEEDGNVSANASIG